MQIDVIGVPIDLGADRRGVDMGPSAIRYAHLHKKIEELGYTLNDHGNIEVPIQEMCSITDPQLKYMDCIVPMARRVSGAVATSIQGGHFPLVLGGERNQPRDLAFGMHPAQPVHEPEQLELRRVVADQAQVAVPGLGHRRTPDPAGRQHGIPPHRRPPGRGGPVRLLPAALAGVQPPPLLLPSAPLQPSLIQRELLTRTFQRALSGDAPASSFERRELALRALTTLQAPSGTAANSGDPLQHGVVGGAEISQATTGATNIYMGVFRVPAGAQSRPHYHESCESAVYMLSGSLEVKWGDRLEQTVTIGPGDMVYVPPRETHLLTNLSDADAAEYVVARDSPTEDSVEVPWAGDT